MKRYLTSYSKGRLSVRDRITGQTASEGFIDADTAEYIQNKIKSCNYTIPQKCPKVKTMTFDDCQDWIESINTDFRAEFGWIKPESISWSRDEVKETIRNTETRIDKLNRLLGIE